MRFREEAARKAKIKDLKTGDLFTIIVEDKDIGTEGYFIFLEDEEATPIINYERYRSLNLNNNKIEEFCNPNVEVQVIDNYEIVIRN